MKILGISGLSHDGAMCYIQGNEILYASHTERYSRIKNDPDIPYFDILCAISDFGMPDKIAFYERPLLKKTRQLYAGQFKEVFTYKNLPRYQINTHLPVLSEVPITYVKHHTSHAAAAALTSGFSKCAIMVVDAIGEWETITTWQYAAPNYFKKISSVNYPSSIGLLYSAFTEYIGLKPNEDEYITMGMAAYGNKNKALKLKRKILDYFFKDWIHLKVNVHRGIRHLFSEELKGYEIADIALAIQLVIEEKIFLIAHQLKHITKEENLCIGGGVALNCVANTQLWNLYNDIWIMPNPGDAGSSLGCAAYVYGDKLNWKGPYLGHNIAGKYPVRKLLNTLLKDKIAGVANGKAEFGPRALGNRSLLADPRGATIKEKVNNIKKRQQFRPFSPVILEEHADTYFDRTAIKRLDYMQYVVKCKYPEKYPAIVHVDGTSRVQTVNEQQHPGLYGLLTEFYNETKCPMLLNTSLNIKGEPIVNNEADANAFALRYNVPVHLRDI